MNGHASIRGVWYQLDFSRTKGFGSITAYEASTSGSAVRCLDTILDSPIDGRFFECKAYDNYSPSQAMNQLRGITGGPNNAPLWSQYRVVMNTRSSETLDNAAARLLDKMTEGTAANNPPFSGIIETLGRNAGGFDLSAWRQAGNTFEGALTATGPQRDVITRLRELMFRGHPFDPPVGVGP